MSNMLEQAIVDAKTLREAAVKNAESALIEKYADEVKAGVEQLLEAEQDEPGETGEEIFAGENFGDPAADESSATDQVPLAHISDDEEMITVNLDDIAPTTTSEPEEEFTLDREEIADEVGISLNGEESPANRDDEVELDESDLIDMFKEMLTVDAPSIEVEQSKEEAEEEDHQEVEEKEFVQTDGMNEDDIEEYYRTMAKYENLQREHKNLKKVLNQFKEQLQETNLHNARLLYTNRVLSTTSLNEQQKNKIVDMVKNARSVDEAKMVFETLQKTMAAETPSGNRSKSLSETISRPSSVILSGRTQNTNKTERNPTVNRWATLAGLKKQ